MILRLKERVLLLDEINRLGKKTKEEAENSTAKKPPKPKSKWRKLAPSPEIVSQI